MYGLGLSYRDISKHIEDMYQIELSTGTISNITDKIKDGGKYDTNADRTKHSFEAVALHELGHVLGLYHEDRTLATMNSYYPNGGPIGHYNISEVHGNDRNGVRFLYPDSTLETDIIASKYNLKDSPVIVADEIDIPTSARRGDIISVKYTTENLSTSTKQYRVAFYFSSNDYISISDTLLSDNTLITSPAGSSGTHTKNLTIPIRANLGTNYIGFIVDAHSENSESDESNNFISLGEIHIY